MKLSEISISRPILAAMMSLGLVIFGVVGVMRLPVRELPDIDPPIISVTTVYQGASASVMETQVTELLEDILMSVDGIRTISSESRQQVSTITLEFNLSRPIEVVAQDVRDRVSRVRGKLPEDVEEPIIAKQEADASPILWVALYSDRHSTLELSKIAEDQFKDRLQTVQGVSSVILGGQKRFAIRLRLDANRMASQRVSVIDVRDALRRENVELPSGLSENLERYLAIETRGQMKSPEEYNRLVIKRVGDSVIRLADVGEAVIGVEDEHSIARFNSKPALGIGVIKQSKANTIDVVAQVKKEVERLKPTLPVGVQTSFPYDESVYVQNSIVEVWETLAIAFVLVVLTIFIFLHNARSTFIPAIAIPVCIVSTFGVLYGMGFSINIVTMLGLVLAIGLVVDDAIIVLENIYRHIEEGMAPMQAAVMGMKEIGFVVIATTIALVCVFLPMAFQTSVTGRLFIEFAVAICASVLISAFVALSLTPSLSARILKPVDPNHKLTGLLAMFESFVTSTTKTYMSMLAWALRHGIIVGIVTIICLGLTFLFYTRLDREFVPLEDKGRFLIFAITPEGSTAEYTDRMVRKMEGILTALPETKEYFSAVALPWGGPGKTEQGLGFVRLKDKRKRDLREIVQSPMGLGTQFFMQVQGAFGIPIMPKSFGGGFTQPFELVIQSQDLDALYRYSDGFVNKLRGMGFLMNVRSNFELNKPELRVSIDRERAAQLGVSVEDIATTLQIAFGGLDISKVNINGKQYDVIAQLVREQRLLPTDLDILFVHNNKGDMVQLSNLVTYETGAGPSGIHHYNRMRSAIIEATPVGGMPLGAVMSKVEGMIKSDLPAGFSYEWKGETKELVESSKGIYFVMILAIIVIYMVLASQFESLVHPLTVMLTIPLAAFGAFGLLWLLSLMKIPSMGVNLYSQIGMVLLFGLVTKNAIMLVDFANQQIAKGLSAHEAMLAAGKIRLRPILMTACATIAGILPIAIGFGASGEARRPLGVAAIGGMLTSTFLTLFVIPVVYVWFANLFKKSKAADSRSTVRSIVIFALLLPFIGGCVTAPKAHVPMTLPEGFKNEPVPIKYSMPEKWWAAFEDAELTDLITKALAYNQELKSAMSAVDKARALSRVDEAGLYPTLDVNAEAKRSRTSKNSSAQFSFDKNITSNHFSVPLDFSYELDIWGKVRQMYASGRYEAYAVKHAADTVLLTLISDVAQEYFYLRSLDAKVSALEKTVELYKRVEGILESRLSAGLSSELELSKARTELSKVQVDIIDAKRLRAKSENALSLLCGQMPGQFSIDPVDSYNAQGPIIGAGIPSELLRNRPDILEADNKMLAASARVGVAKADFFPSINILATGGFESIETNTLFENGSAIWSVGPQITLPIFHGGKKRAQLSAAKAEFEQTQSQYRQVVLNAFREVEDALVDLHMRSDEYAAQQKLLRSAEETYQISYDRYNQGLVSYLDVVDAQRQRLQAQLETIRSHTDHLIAAVNLIKATGGRHVSQSKF